MSYELTRRIAKIEQERDEADAKLREEIAELRERVEKIERILAAVSARPQKPRKNDGSEEPDEGG